MARIHGLIAALVMTLSLALVAGSARADENTGEAVRAVIGQQIAAFRADDGGAAYERAAPSIRQIFTDVDTFMAMVKSGYQPVYRPRSVTFGRLHEDGDRVVQEVFVVGPDGEPYTALYALQKQPDGSWKISGCRIAKTVARSA
jgi:ketosteroid isomerase-like protein